MAHPSCVFCTKTIYFNLVQQHVTQQAICVWQLKSSPLSSHRNYVPVGLQYHFSQKQEILLQGSMKQKDALR